MSDTHNPPYWIDHLCAVLGITKNIQIVRFFKAMSRAEGGTAKWNPLNTTLSLGSQWTEPTDYNSVGVKNYKYAVAGVCATALTFIQRGGDGTLRYGHLLNDLQTGTKSAEEIVESNRPQINLWGTNPDLMLAVLKDLAG